MLRTPSSKKRKRLPAKVNLIPILDAVFIFILFLLTSANFSTIYEIQSDIPLVSDQDPPKKEKPPLALTLEVNEEELSLLTGIPSKVLTKIPKASTGSHDLEKLHSVLLNLKKEHIDEETIILEPKINLTYEEIVKIMDSVRLIRSTDEALYKKDKGGVDVKIKTLFSKIIFGNSMS